MVRIVRAARLMRASRVASADRDLRSVGLLRLFVGTNSTASGGWSVKKNRLVIKRKADVTRDVASAEFT